MDVDVRERPRGGRGCSFAGGFGWAQNIEVLPTKTHRKAWFWVLLPPPKPQCLRDLIHRSTHLQPPFAQPPQLPAVRRGPSPVAFERDHGAGRVGRPRGHPSLLSWDSRWDAIDWPNKKMRLRLHEVVAGPVRWRWEVVGRLGGCWDCEKRERNKGHSLADVCSWIFKGGGSWLEIPSKSFHPTSSVPFE